MSVPRNCGTAAPTGRVSDEAVMVSPIVCWLISRLSDRSYRIYGAGNVALCLGAVVEFK
jgi:hypothetical protein